MGIHVLIFLGTGAFILGIRTGLVKGEMVRSQKAIRLCILVILAGNLLGVLLSAEEEKRDPFRDGYRFRKEEN